MSIIIKTIHGKRYAYAAYRAGEKVVHKYLGPVSRPGVKAAIAEIESMGKVPETFRPLFWDTDAAKIDVRKNSRYIVERVLELGGLDALIWMERFYPARKIIEVLKTSRKISKKSKNFWEVWFNAS